MLLIKRNLSTIFANFCLLIICTCLSIGFVGCSDESSEIEGESTIEESELCLVEIDGEFVEIELDEMPEYLNGGDSGFVDDIYMILKYPAEARENSVEGVCIANYEITKEGTVENLVILQDPGEGIGDEVFGVLESITAGVSFKAGILDGNLVRVKKETLIKFRLEG